MKILHTSDWHLGQSFFTKSRKREHAAFLKWLVEQVELNQIDAVIVAGDVFDTGTPPSYARELYHEFIGALQGKECTLVVLGGNHDSVSVLNESKALLKYLNSHVIASTYGDITEQLVALNDRNGKPGAIICAVPFIRPRDVITSEAGQDAIAKRQALGDAIKQHYATLYQRALALKETLEKQYHRALPIVATGHLTALGVSQSESVRDIYIGTLEGFDAKGFPPADYIALGHIHRPQKVAKKDHIRYSGSPIPLSFDELNTTKQVVVVEFPNIAIEEVATLPPSSSTVTPIITPIEIPRFQAMEVVKGDLQGIETAIANSEAIANAREEEPVWLCVEVDTQDYLTDLQQRVQRLLDGKHAEILQLKRIRRQSVRQLSSERNVQLSELTVDEVFQARLKLENLDNDVSEQGDLLSQKIEHNNELENSPKNGLNAARPSRRSRMEVLFAKAVERVQCNDEDNLEQPQQVSTPVPECSSINDEGE
ncbi:exonuclease subunit SbcD [Alteromonas sp. D210916BOD_24]|uniref:exonuclease subunit SbcD n=1 Tax=Alteromonas sp. D210916BOD_24 TaxID=3157618 RepID=UPI00399CE1A2